MAVARSSLWGIVLAGGEGERLRPFVRERLGVDVPKQFCAFVGQRTMLERTIRRAKLLIPSERLVVSGTAHHQSYLFHSLGAHPPGTVLLQPANRDTAPGILLPLIHILRKDPDALVALFPSDHFIMPGRRFMRAVAEAADFVTKARADAPVILAVEPGWPEAEYGWIEPGRVVGSDERRTIRWVERFVEKPSRERADILIQDGWLWNTMVIVSKAAALMTLMQKRLPDLAAAFSLLQRFIGSVWEHDLIDELYRTIPRINFSTSVLAGGNATSLVLPIRNVLWSDWGTKERILDTAMDLGLPEPVPVRAHRDGLALPA